MKHSLIRKNVCHMFDHGIYDGRRAIIMPRLGLDWSEYLAENYPQGYPYELLCKGARYAVRIEFENEFHSFILLY